MVELVFANGTAGQMWTPGVALSEVLGSFEASFAWANLVDFLHDSFRPKSK